MVHALRRHGWRGWERVKIIDFGIVKLASDVAAAFGAGALTCTGFVVGKPRRRAPGAHQLRARVPLGRRRDGEPLLDGVGETSDAVMMKLGVVVAVCLIGCGGSAPPRSTAEPRQEPAAQAQVSPVDREMLDVIERYLAAPLDTPEDARARIVRFAAESKAVSVVFDENTTPWIMEEGIDEGLKQHLLAGFIAGNVASQLRSGKKADDLRAGLEALLRVYRPLRAKGLTSASMEKLVEIEAKGELGAHVDQILAARKGAGL